MRRLLLILPTLLAACTVPPEGPGPSGLASAFQGPAEPPAPEPLPPRVLAALPPGVPTSVVQRNADGCYLLSIEVTDPPSGYPLRDAAGLPVCEGGAVPVAALAPGVPPPLVVGPGTIAPPAPLAPLNPG